jgi:hypothetical protein
MSPTDSSLQNWRIKAPLFIGFDVDDAQIVLRKYGNNMCGGDVAGGADTDMLAQVQPDKGVVGKRQAVA